MQYSPCEHTKETRDWTSRRLAAAKRAVQADADSVALFPEMRKWKTLDDRIEYIDSREEKMITHMRNSRAKGWRNVRRYLERLGPTARYKILADWNQGWLPQVPSNLWYLIQKHGYATPEQVKEAIGL